MANRKYLVTGATGATGSAVVKLLLDKKKEVRALVHSEDPRAQRYVSSVRRLSRETCSTSNQCVRVSKESTRHTLFTPSCRAFSRPLPTSRKQRRK